MKFLRAYKQTILAIGDTADTPFVGISMEIKKPVFAGKKAR